MVLAFIAATFAAPLVRPDGRSSEGSPLEAADRVEVGTYRPNAIRALHAAEDRSVRERDRLWVTYVKWLQEEGYVPARENHSAPWQQCRWQRFEREDGAVELDIRRRNDESAWQVLIMTRGGGSSGAPG